MTGAGEPNDHTTDIVDAIRNTPVAKHPKSPSPSAVTPVEPVVIRSVAVVGEFDRAAIEARIAAAKAEAGSALDRFLAKLVEEHGGEVQETPSGLLYLVLTEGEGDSPSPSANVTVHYTGTFLDGQVFDSSRDRGQPATFPLNRVIAGWTEGVGMMKPGGRRFLVIPFPLAYGASGRPPVIPPKATLVFDVELLEVK